MFDIQIKKIRQSVEATGDCALPEMPDKMKLTKAEIAADIAALISFAVFIGVLIYALGVLEALL